MTTVTRTRQGLTVRKVITNAEMLTLQATAVEVIPAPGSGLILFPTSAYLRLTWAADYTNISNDANMFLGDDNLLTFLAGLRNYNVGAGPRTNLSDLLAAGQDADSGWGMRAVTFPVANGFPVAIESGEASAGNGVLVDNLPVNLWLLNVAGNLTGGSILNELSVTVFYNVVRV